MHSWHAVGALRTQKFKLNSFENPETNILRSEYSHACFARCQEFETVHFYTAVVQQRTQKQSRSYFFIPLLLSPLLFVIISSADL